MDTGPARVEAIFDGAVAQPSDAEREAYLRQVCAGDEVLRRKIDALLMADRRGGNFLDFQGEGIGTQLATQSSQALTESPGSVIGRYKLLEEIGQGGFGVVFMAEQQFPLRRRVALKIIKPGMDTKQVVARFEAERQALALMDHPNIARVFDGGSTESGRPYFVMELVRGAAITEYCDREKLKTRERLELFMQVCQATQHAHQKGIIHRDIKPSNVLVTIRDDKPVPKVIDFGIAKAINQQLTEKTLFTEFRQMIGTPAYMSPEQAQRDAFDIDTRTDIYSLGVLLYELLTGSTPFDARSLRAAAYDEIRRIIRDVEPPKPSTRLSSMGIELDGVGERRQIEGQRLARSVRGDLDWLVMKCLEKDRARRYETASALLRDVQHYLNDEPVEASPPTALYRLRKLSKKYRKSLGVVATIAFLLVSGILVSAWQAVRATRAEVAAQIDRGNAFSALSAADAARVAETAARHEAVNQKEVAEKALSESETESYFASIYAADAARNFANTDTVQEFLQAAPVRLRNWEWRYLNAETSTQIMTLHFPDIAQGTRFSPDGKQIVSICHDETIHFFDARTGRELRSVRGKGLRAHPDGVSLDGQRIAAWRGTDSLRIWDADGNEIAVCNNSKTVRHTAFSADGKRLVSAGEIPQVWDVETGRQIMVLKGDTARVNNASFSRDGTRIVTSAQDGMVRIWDANTGACLLAYHLPWQVVDSRFSLDGLLVASAGYGSYVSVWDPLTGREIAQLPGHDSVLTAVEFSPDSKRVATAAARVTRIFDAASGKLLQTVVGHTDRVASVDFSPDGTHLVTASLDSTVRVWNLAGSVPSMVLGTPRSQATRAEINAAGTRAITVQNDGTCLWDCSGGKLIAKLATGSLGQQTDCASFNAAGSQVLTTAPDNTIRLWDAMTGQLTATFARQDGPVSCAVFSPDGKTVAGATQAGIIRIWTLIGQQPSVVVQAAASGAERLVFSPDGTRLAAYRDEVNNTISVWDTRMGKQLCTILETTPARISNWYHSVVFSPDGKSVLTASENSTACIWDATTGKQNASLYHPHGPVRWAAYSPDGSRIVTACQDSMSYVWDVASGNKLLTLRGHETGVCSAQFSPDGSRIVTASADKTVRIWDALTGRQCLVLRGHDASVQTADFSKEGRVILSLSKDGTARLWDSVSNEERAQATISAMDIAVSTAPSSQPAPANMP